VIEGRRQRGLGARLRAFWTGPYWWLLALLLLVGPSLVVLIASRLGQGAAPFVYNAF